MSTFLTATVAERPNVAGLMLLVISVGRFLYGKGYKSNDLANRFPFFLLSQFATCVGVGYGALLGASIFGLGPFK